MGRPFGVMNKFISPKETSFFKGRLLMDVVVVVNELVSLFKKSKKYCLIFKVDFEKTYVSTSWSFSRLYAF